MILNYKVEQKKSTDYFFTFKFAPVKNEEIFQNKEYA